MSNELPFKGKDIVLGVTGGIAAYKAAEIVSRLRKKGAEVFVVMTKNATEFIAPLTFETLSGHPVATDTFMRPATWEVEHIALAKRATLFLVAPATANILAKMANGIADDMLSTTILATKAPVLVAPAMNTGMWTAEATRENMKTLLHRGVKQVGPEEGLLACGDTGAGRMAEPETIVDAAIDMLQNAKGDLCGVKLLVTAGPTRERIDPVRYMTNDSSGKMGYAIAEAAKARGAQVTLVTGPVGILPPDGVDVLKVESTQDLYDTLIKKAPEMDIVIQAAAPADFTPVSPSNDKIKKKSGEPLELKFKETPDVAKAIGANKRDDQVYIGFAAETRDLIQNAKRKLESKNFDMIVANDVTMPGAGFLVDTNIAALISRDFVKERPLQAKTALAEDILDEATIMLQRKKG